MYPVITSQRDARRIDVPRRLDAGRWPLDVDGVVGALADADAGVAVRAQQPDRAPPTGPMPLRAHPRGRGRRGAAAAGRRRRGLLRVHRPDRDPLAGELPAPRRGAHAVEGLRPGRHPRRAGPSRHAPTIARLERVRPAGSVSTMSAALAAEALRRPAEARSARAAARRRARVAGAPPRGRRLDALPQRDQLPARAASARPTMPPCRRAPPPPGPRAAHLRPRQPASPATCASPCAAARRTSASWRPSPPSDAPRRAAARRSPGLPKPAQPMFCTQRRQRRRNQPSTVGCCAARTIRRWNGVSATSQGPCSVAVNAGRKTGASGRDRGSPTGSRSR